MAKTRNPTDATLRNVRAQKKRELLAKDQVLNLTGSLDHRVTNLSNYLDDIWRRLTVIEIKLKALEPPKTPRRARARAKR